MAENKLTVPKRRTRKKTSGRSPVNRFIDFTARYYSVLMLIFIFILILWAAFSTDMINPALQDAHGETFRVCAFIALGSLLPFLGQIVENALKEFRKVDEGATGLVEGTTATMFFCFLATLIVLGVFLAFSYLQVSSLSGKAPHTLKLVQVLLHMFEITFGAFLTSLASYHEYKKLVLVREISEKSRT